MDNSPTDATEGLVEGVGLELIPYPPSTTGGQTTNAPMQPQNGQWTLRFNYADTTKLSAFVTVSFGPPFAPTADLYADMTKAQVGNLKDWLIRIYNLMGGPTQTTAPTTPPPPGPSP